jgi:hypothetical protein
MVRRSQGHALRGVMVSVLQTLLSFAQNYMPNYHVVYGGYLDPYKLKF